MDKNPQTLQQAIEQMHEAILNLRKVIEVEIHLVETVERLEKFIKKLETKND